MGSGEKMKTYKGFDKDLKCRGFQYEIGKEYEEEKADVCKHGFHACEMPIEVLRYYAPGEGSRYCEVDQSGDISKHSDDSKVASTKIKIGAEIGIPGLVKAQIEYVRSHCTNEHNAEPGKPATAGNYGAATAGFKGAATAGDSGAATAGNYGAATSRGSVSVGENGVGTVRGEGVKIKGGMGALIVCAVERCDSFEVKTWAAAIVDGNNIKADTWYTVENGKFVEAE